MRKKKMPGARPFESRNKVAEAKKNRKQSHIPTDKDKETQIMEEDLKKKKKPSDNKTGGKTRLHQKLARRWLQSLAWLINFIVPNIISILLGFDPFPQDSPLINLIKSHPIVILVICGILALFTCITLFIYYQPQSEKGTGETERDTNFHISTWKIVTTLSTISFLVSSSLLAITLARPQWCPPTLCPSPQAITRGTHDTNLDVYLVSIQSTAFVIPGNPESYSEKNLPEDIGAVQLNTDGSSSNYSLVLGVHSLQQGRYGILIDQVELVVKQVAPVPQPLNAWIKGPPLIYNTNLYQVQYNGQPVGERLSALYAPVPYGHVQLAPGEADQLNIHISSQTTGTVQFFIQVTYRITNTSQRFTIALPNTFQVVFSDTSNWYQYKLQNGHFVS